MAGRRPAGLARAREAGPERQLERYLAGWAAADLGRIVAAVAADYRLEDPLVGVFDRDGLGAYLALLRQRVGFGALRVYRHKVWFEGPAALPALGRPLRFWRALPETGLAGTCEIELGAAGVRRERLCYEANLATEQLRAARPALE
jgi:hypothetical protein